MRLSVLHLSGLVRTRRSLLLVNDLLLLLSRRRRLLVRSRRWRLLVDYLSLLRRRCVHHLLLRWRGVNHLLLRRWRFVHDLCLSDDRLGGLLHDYHRRRPAYHTITDISAFYSKQYIEKATQ